MNCVDFETLLGRIATAVECICSTSSSIDPAPTEITLVTKEILDEYVRNGDATWDNPYIGDWSTGVDSERCAIAQLTYQIGYDLLVEEIQPAQGRTMDVLVPLTLGAIATFLGLSLTAPPVAGVVALLTVVILVWADGKLADVQGVLDTHKQQLVCAVYDGLAVSTRQAESNAAAVIDDMNIPFSDRTIFKLLYAPWIQRMAEAAWTEQSPWAVAAVESGYCLDCDTIEGSDWVAYARNETITLDHSASAIPQYVHQCLYEDVPDGQTWVGMVIEVTTRMGCPNFRRTGANYYDCSGYDALMWDNEWATPLNGTGRFMFLHQFSGINNAEAFQTLAPDGQHFYATNMHTGPTRICGALDFGGPSCTGGLSGTRLYDVYIKP